MSAGQTMTIIHRGCRVLIREGIDGTIEIKSGKHREVGEWSTFGQACRYAMKWIIDNSGRINEEDYER